MLISETIDAPGNDLAGGLRRLFPIAARPEAPAIAAGTTIATHDADPGSGSLLGAPGSAPSIASIFGPTEDAIINASSMANAGTWESAASAIAPNATMLQTMAQGASGGGVNLQLGPQMDFAPIGGGSSASAGGGGMGVFLLLGLGIVGALVYYHFRKEHAHSGAATA